MEHMIYSNRITSLMKYKCLFTVCIVVLLLFFESPCSAFDAIEVLGKPFRAMGYVNQGIGYGIGGDHYDTKEGWQSFKYDILLETQYELDSDFRLFVSGMLSGDLAFDVLSDNSEWQRKGFSGARDNLAHDTVFRDLLQEAHITWTPRNSLFRIGKQIVVWGDMDAWRITDQINPIDQRRGITDVEFESTILPIWLARAESFIPSDSSWVRDLGIEIIFNPNADFEANRNIAPGNDRLGIWAANATVPIGGPYPMDFFHVGALDQAIEEPDAWDSDYFEYGFRFKATIFDSIINLNYFYGRDNDPILKNLPLPPTMEPTPFDGRMVLHPKQGGFYPRFRMVGFTLTRDLEKLYIKGLGGVSPVLHFEGFYGADNTFSTTLPPGLDDFETHDEIRSAIGFDWKIKVNWLNPRAYITIMPQFYYRHIMDYPSGYGLMTTPGPVKENNYQSFLRIATTYFHNKLEPSVVWIEDYTLEGGFIRPQLLYEYSDKWNFTLGAIFIYGDEPGVGLTALENKDHIYLTVSYKF